MWSQAFAALGLLQSSSAQNKATSLSRQQYELEKEMWEWERDQRAEEYAYQRGLSEDDRATKADERAFSEAQLEEYKKQILAEREFEIDRMLRLDKEAASQRAFQLEQYLANKNLREEERALALRQLEEAKAIAKGERDEERKRFELAKAQKQIERNFQLKEYGEAKATAQAERQYMLDQRKAIMDQIYGLQSGLRDTYAGLQDVPDVERISEADIEAEIKRRQGEYTADVDRAATAVASVNEADLIRDGMDLSTKGTARRGDIASRLAQEYQNARSRAYDDSMGFIAGKQGVRNTDLNTILASRGSQLGQAGDVLGAGIGMMGQLPTAPSALDGYNYGNVGSGVYDRAFSTSANSFQDKYGLMSGADNEFFKIQSNLSNVTGPKSGAYAGGMSLGTGVYSPYQGATYNPSNYLNNMSTYASNNLNYANQQASNAAEVFGTGLKDWEKANPNSPYAWGNFWK